MLCKLQTLTGVPLPEVPALLDAPLPPEGYKRIPGPGNLTDICPNWTKRILSLVYGPCGMGWGFDFAPANIDIRFETNSKDKAVPCCRVIGTFWYVTVNTSTGEINRHVIPVTGANKSEFGNEGYALKGAVTNAIGNGASMIGFQESIYLKQRNHDNPNGQADPISLPEFPAENPPSAPAADVPKSGSPSPAKVSSGDMQATARAVETVSPTKAPAPVDPVGVDQEQPPAGAGAKIADKLNIRRKWATCISCGWGACAHESEPNLPACPECGVVAGEAFVFSPSEEHFTKVQANTKARLEAAKAKPVVEPPKRRSVRQPKPAATTTPPTTDTGTSVPDPQPHVCGGGCGVSLSGLRNCPICDAAPIPGQGVPCPIPEGAPPARAEITRQVYRLGGRLGHADLPAILAAVSDAAGKQVTSSNQLSDDELIEAWKTFAFQVAQKEQGK